MQIGTLFILLFSCLICRCIIFRKQDKKWWTAMIPGYNKLILGKLSNTKVLGILNCIFHVLLHLTFIFCLSYELWVIDKYAQEVQISETQSIVQVLVPVYIAKISQIAIYLLIGFMIIACIVWAMMMWKFTLTQKRSPWWILLWVIIPIIPYIYFANTSIIYCNGKKYIYKKVEA